jgi:hypothetical protein
MNRVWKGKWRDGAAYESILYPVLTVTAFRIRIKEPRSRISGAGALC